MSDFDDAIGDAVDTLVSEAGGEWLYCRGNDTATFTARRSTLPPILIDNGNGAIVEIRPIDFVCRPTELPYTVPLRGDKIKGDGKLYEVQPQSGEKVWRQISPQMIRIHCKQVG